MVKYNLTSEFILSSPRLMSEAELDDLKCDIISKIINALPDCDLDGYLSIKPAKQEALASNPSVGLEHLTGSSVLIRSSSLDDARAPGYDGFDDKS